MAGESSDDEGPEEVSLQSGRDAAAQQRSQEKEVTQKSRCVPPSRLAQVACTLTHSTTPHGGAPDGSGDGLWVVGVTDGKRNVLDRTDRQTGQDRPPIIGSESCRRT